jgi:hypothetical protein
MSAIVKTKTHFTFHIDVWDSAGENIMDHLGGLDDYLMAVSRLDRAEAVQAGLRCQVQQHLFGTDFTFDLSSFGFASISLASVMVKSVSVTFLTAAFAFSLSWFSGLASRM